MVLQHLRIELIAFPLIYVTFLEALLGQLGRLLGRALLDGVDGSEPQSRLERPVGFYVKALTDITTLKLFLISSSVAVDKRVGVQIDAGKGKGHL